MSTLQQEKMCLLQFRQYIHYYVALVCPFAYTAFVVSGKVEDPVNRFHHTSWMIVVTQTNRPKSLRNRCVIEVFGSVLCCQFVDLVQSLFLLM